MGRNEEAVPAVVEAKGVWSGVSIRCYVCGVLTWPWQLRRERGKDMCVDPIACLRRVGEEA